MAGVLPFWGNNFRWYAHGREPLCGFRFSFLLAVPMMMGATVLDLYKSLKFLTVGDIPMFAVGFVTAFIVALIADQTFLELIKRISS